MTEQKRGHFVCGIQSHNLHRTEATHNWIFRLLREKCCMTQQSRLTRWSEHICTKYQHIISCRHEMSPAWFHLFPGIPGIHRGDPATTDSTEHESVHMPGNSEQPHSISTASAWQAENSIKQNPSSDTIIKAPHTFPIAWKIANWSN